MPPTTGFSVVSLGPSCLQDSKWSPGYRATCWVHLTVHTRDMETSYKKDIMRASSPPAQSHRGTPMPTAPMGDNHAPGPESPPRQGPARTTHMQQTCQGRKEENSSVLFENRTSAL